MDDKKQPIVIKKVKKGGHGHHGGAWKVAYADFVTAMMAFFLLMWLLGSTSQAERAGISDYFNNPSAVQGPGGASTSMIELGGALEVPQGEGEPLRENRPTEDLSQEDLAALLEDQARLDELMRKLKEQIESSPTLKDFKDQLLLDITSEGLRIQIVDKANRPMFALGSAVLKWYTKEILHEIAKTINEVPNHTSITGHTDATPYSSDRTDYSNWELSADRANAARRELIFGGMRKAKIGRVVGLASSVMFDRENPYNPINRRISIVVLNRLTERAIGLPALSDGAGQNGDAGGDSVPVLGDTPVAEPKDAPVARSNDATATRASASPAGVADEKKPVEGSGLENALESVLGPPAR